MVQTEYLVRQLTLSDKRGWALDGNGVLCTFPFALWDAARVAERRGHSSTAMRIEVEARCGKPVLVHCLYLPSACWMGFTFWGRKPEWVRVESRDQAVDGAVARLITAWRRQPQAVAV
jgi:hypothetical protein